MLRVLLLVCVLLCLRSETSCQDRIPFNVDLKYPILVPSNELSNELQMRNSQQPSLFGSSLLVTSTETQSTHNLFIGAPSLVSKSNSSLITGSIFKCELNIDQNTQRIDCSEIDISQAKGSVNYVPRNRSLVGFNFGATSNNVVSCAPSWVSSTETPEGLCFMLDRSRGDPVYVFKSELKKRVNANRPYESHTLFGFSVAYDSTNQQLLIGTPGFNDFAGAVSAVRSDMQSVRLRQKVLAKANTYHGFAVHFCPFGQFQAVAVGTPKHNKFNGKVELVDIWSFDVILTLFSQEDGPGEFFGASIVSISVRSPNSADTRRDLLVGAPLFSMRNKREIGRVYYYRDLQQFNGRNRRSAEIILPKLSRVGATFGTAIASFDLNTDGFTDVIISAPFESVTDTSSGAIYIYYGGVNGLELSIERRIGAETFAKQALRGFGYSLWTESDVDNNGNNDLVIGSALSERVFILRSMPIVILQVSLEFDHKGVNLSDISQCRTENACFRVKYCIDALPDTNNFAQEITYSVQLTVTDRKLRIKENRVITDKMRQIVTTNKKHTCEPGFYVEIKKQEDIYDIITPIEVQVNVSLNVPNMSTFCPWCPVANPVTVFKEIPFEHGCSKKRCIADLKLEVDFKYGPNLINTEIVQGQYSNIEVIVGVLNKGESSIDTQLWISAKPWALTVNFETRCRLNIDALGYLCEVNKLLKNNQREEFKLQFDLANVALDRFTFDLQVNTSSELTPTSKTRASKQIVVTKKATIKLEQRTEHHNHSFSDQTPRVPFPVSFRIEKSGPSSVNSTKIEFYLPSDIIEIDSTSKYSCHQVDSVRTTISASSLVNATLNMPCIKHANLCSRHECTVGALEPGAQTVNFDLTLMFHPSRISSKMAYEVMHFEMRVNLLTNDVFFKESLLASASTEFIFERQITALESKTSPLIMIGGGGIGLLILLITVIVLIKNGFFRRKKREELLRVKQRMSMNPNLVVPNFDGTRQDENEDSD